MKTWLVIISLASFLMGSCDNRTVQGQNPSDIPVQWVNDLVQDNELGMINLLNENVNKDVRVLDPAKKGDNHKKITNYSLYEWKKDKDTYFYEIMYVDPNDGQKTGDHMEVIQTKNGWKRAEYLPPRPFEKYTEGLKKKVIREMDK